MIWAMVLAGVCVRLCMGGGGVAQLCFRAHPIVAKHRWLLHQTFNQYGTCEIYTIQYVEYSVKTDQFKYGINQQDQVNSVIQENIN